MLDVVIHGLGHVGLPLAAAIARVHRVFGVDPRGAAVLEGAEREPGLVEAAGRVRLEGPVERVDVAIVAVPTPLGSEGADLTAVREATADAVAKLKSGGLLLVASTCPMGTARALVVPEGIRVATMPERGMPGQMLAEVIGAPRLVGGVGVGDTEAAVDFVKSWCEGEVTGAVAEEVELAKLVENSWRDLSIGFVNELVSVVGEELGRRVVQLASSHPRVELARPGIGVGGHCLPVDPHFLPEGMTLPRRARVVNEARVARMVELVVERARALGVSDVGCLGLSYKPETADARNAPAVRIVEGLVAAGLEVRAHDPYVGEVGVPRAGLDEVLGCGLVVRLVGHGVYGGVEVGLDLVGE